MTDLTLENSRWKHLWSLSPKLDFLNHGSFGACPRSIQEEQYRFKKRLESHPVDFILSEQPALQEKARVVLADFIGAVPEDVALLPNATTAVNTVLRSLFFQPNDQILITNHTYGACRNAVNFVAKQVKAEVVVAEIPFPIQSPEEAFDAIVGKATERTKLALIDHITSATGLVLPIEAIVEALQSRGIDVFVDGAHGPGMVPLDLDDLGAAYYTGNCHKWMCAPKGAGFLHVRRDRQEGIEPLVISHGLTEPDVGKHRFQRLFEWPGTTDVSAYLSLPSVIRWGEEVIEGGWQSLRSRNRQLVLRGRDILCDALGIDPPAPDEMIGSIATLPFFDGDASISLSAFAVHPEQQELLDDHNIQIPIFFWPSVPRRCFRISAQLYNELPQYQRLADVLKQIYATKRFAF